MKNEKYISNSIDGLSLLSMMCVSIFIAFYATLQIISFFQWKTVLWHMFNMNIQQCLR